jgi:hypothetical protein
MKQRLNIYLAPDLNDRIGAVAARSGTHKSTLIEAAIASFLSPDATDRREAAFTRRLDKLTSQFERLERDQQIAIETMALFVRFWLAVTPQLPDGQQSAAKTKGAERYRGFVEALGRRLQRGDTLLFEVSREIWPEKFNNHNDATTEETEHASA